MDYDLGYEVLPMSSEWTYGGAGDRFGVRTWSDLKN